MKRAATWTAVSVLTLACGPCCYQASSQSEERPECPGTILCPITGKEICKDQCPLIDPNRPDCPGKIECPLTGELVCSDRCPLGPGSAEKDTVPSCCGRGK